VSQIRLTRALSAVGLFALISGGALIGTSTIAVAATPTLSATVTSSSSGATCSTTPVSGTGVGAVMSLCRNVSGGDVLTLNGAGFTPSALASDVECNSDPAQSMVTLLGNYIPISCTNVKILNVTATGTFTGSFTIKSGTTGPGAAGTPVCTTGSGMPVTTTTIPNCTTSGDGATDAAKYPCPPTPAQQAAGDTCVVAIGDINGDRAVGAIAFAGASTGGTTTSVATTSPPTTAPTATPTTAPTATPTTAAPQTAPSGPLASTGPGPHLWLIALIGFVALFLGAIALALIDSPRRFIGGLSILGGRSGRSGRPGDDGSDRPSEGPASSTAPGLWLSEAAPLWLRSPQH
jgi:hypothetical protein